MNKIYRSGNYIIVETENGVNSEFAISKTVYTSRENPQTNNFEFVLVETGVGSDASGKIRIQEDDVDAGDWFLEDGITEYTVESLTTFLRENTGFNPASGGSGASPKYRAVISLSSDGEAMTNEVLYNNFPNGAPEINQLTTGKSAIDFIDGNPIPQKIDCGSNITDSNGDMWRFSTAFDGIQYQYYQGKSEDGGSTWAFGDFNQTNDDALFCLIIFEYYEPIV